MSLKLKFAFQNLIQEHNNELRNIFDMQWFYFYLTGKEYLKIPMNI